MNRKGAGREAGGDPGVHADRDGGGLSAEDEDFVITYDPLIDSLMIQFYGRRRSMNSPVSRELDALRDPRTKDLLGIELTGFVRNILPTLLGVGVSDQFVGEVRATKEPPPG